MPGTQCGLPGTLVQKHVFSLFGFSCFPLDSNLSGKQETQTEKIASFAATYQAIHTEFLAINGDDEYVLDKEIAWLVDGNHTGWARGTWNRTHHKNLSNPEKVYLILTSSLGRPRLFHHKPKELPWPGWKFRTLRWRFRQWSDEMDKMLRQRIVHAAGRDRDEFILAEGAKSAQREHGILFLKDDFLKRRHDEKEKLVAKLLDDQWFSAQQEHGILVSLILKEDSSSADMQRKRTGMRLQWILAAKRDQDGRMRLLWKKQRLKSV
jgi:hypothetical protein